MGVLVDTVAMIDVVVQIVEALGQDKLNRTHPDRSSKASRWSSVPTRNSFLPLTLTWMSLSPVALLRELVESIVMETWSMHQVPSPAVQVWHQSASLNLREIQLQVVSSAMATF